MLCLESKKNAIKLQRRDINILCGLHVVQSLNMVGILGEFELQRNVGSTFQTGSVQPIQWHGLIRHKKLHRRSNVLRSMFVAYLCKVQQGNIRSPIRLVQEKDRYTRGL